MLEKIKNYLKELVRVFKITKKPSKHEFLSVVKVSAIGIALIGLIGFIISIAWELL